MYMYKAVDKGGKTVDFLLTRRRNKLAAHKFLLRAINNNSCPKVINMIFYGHSSGLSKHLGINSVLRTKNKMQKQRGTPVKRTISLPVGC